VAGPFQQERAIASNPTTISSPFIEWLTRYTQGINLAGTLEEPCGKTTVFLHRHFTARAPCQPACLRFTILVQQNNVREIHADMSKANHSHRLWVWTDVRGLFLESMGSFSLLWI
jgi:hypothetical protein